LRILLTTQQIIVFLMTGMLVFTGMPVFSSPFTMKGPAHSAPHAPIDQTQPASDFRSVLIQTIYLYRSYISPTQGARCGFYPSCSTFGLHAVQHYGAIQGGMMTADRLTRCNLFKKPGPDYYQRPDGRLFDPVKKNLLKEQ